MMTHGNVAEGAGGGGVLGGGVALGLAVGGGGAGEGLGDGDATKGICRTAAPAAAGGALAVGLGGATA